MIKTNNNGGLWGGLGYLGEKLAVGTVSSLEGIVDYTAAGLAKLFGADDWAEDVIANDWFGDWYSHPEEWYNPSESWAVAGDVAGGIGTSLPSIAATVGAVALAAGSGGAAAPVSAGILKAVAAGTSFTVAGLGAAGNATKQAYRDTGELTGKEFGYGAMSGITEGGLEGVTNALSLGGGQIIKGAAKALGKEAAKSATKQGVVKSLGKAFAGEAFEEGMSELLDPYWQRMTYNPSAKDATAQEIAYAAFVGGMSGLVMDGGVATAKSTRNTLRGNKLAKEGKASGILELAQEIAERENMNGTGDETFQNLADTYNQLNKSLAQTGGEVTTINQKRLLGELSVANVAATAKDYIAKRALNIVNDAGTFASRLNEYGYKDANGNPIVYTAEQLTEGYDPQKPSSIYKALKSNEALRRLAVADATGHLMMDSAKFTQATLTGKKLASQVDLNRFIETAPLEYKNAVAQALKIDSWDTLNVDTFNEKISDFIADGGVQKYAKLYAQIKAMEAISDSEARPMPKAVNIKEDGSVRYSDGKTSIAITKTGDEYIVYDYSTGYPFRPMTRAEVNRFLREYAYSKARAIETVGASGDIRYALVGRTEDGRGIYRSNYSQNTPKTEKQKDIINLVQNVWSKNPIHLNLIVDGKPVSIEARFNPELTERSDLSKIAFGNRKGTASEKRITMNLSSDLYQIAEESHHVGSKTETGKDVATHSGVTIWHYFVTDLIYIDADNTAIDCYMNIDVKQNESGNWFYSFGIEKGSRPADVLSVVTDKTATTSINSIPDSAENVNRYSEKTVYDTANVNDSGDIRYALPYDDAIDKIKSDTLDTAKNTHLRVSQHTPQIYIDKAGASDREIVMSWDVAYLAMKKNGKIPGNYHGLGADIMKALPRALEDPLYIVKQKNGRIAAVTKIIVKGKRAVFAAIELDTYQTTIQEGETEAKEYNLVVTVTDAKPNYLQNTIFGGEIVYNKNDEDPAHFILRLKSLEKAVPIYDLAESSMNSIPDSAENVNRYSEKTAYDTDNINDMNAKSQTEEIDAFARENIPDYKRLNDPNQSMIRKLIREGRALGVAEADIIACAAVSARSGLNVVFDKQATYKGKNKAGEDVYADGFYDPNGNRIIINPDSKRSQEKILIHELDHAIRQYLGNDGVRHAKIFRKALEGVSPEVSQRIAKSYKGVKSNVSHIELLMDETNAYYAQEILSNQHTLERLVQTEPTLKDKILSFFMGASKDYESFPRLSKAARSYYRTYKKLFDSFSQGNFQNNSLDLTKQDEITKKAAKEIADRKAYRYSIDADLLEFVDSVSAMESKNAISKRKHSLGKISETHAKIVEDVLSSELGLNIDAGRYTVNIDGSAVKHIEEKHGANGSSDHSMQNKADVARIGWAVNNAESGYIARTQTGEIDYSTQYRNTDGSPSPKIILEKSIGDGKFIVAECVPDAAAKKIHIISARKIKSGNGQVLNVKSNDSPQPTSETLLDGITATDIITEKSQNVNRNSENSSDERHALPYGEEAYDSSRITTGMSEDERYEVLKDKDITVSAKTDKTKLESVMSKLDITERDVEFSKYGDRVRLFKKLGEEFSVFRGYSNRDIKLDFSFSKENMRESVSKQRKGYLRLAKLLTCIDSVIENAVGIEVHNRNAEGYKTDGTLNNVYVLASAFVDGENIIPVKLEVKEFSDKENTLHVAIALESINKDGIVKQEVAQEGVARQYSPPSIISISDYFKKINPSDESFLKYIPDGFLNEVQLEAKRKAIETDERKGKTKKQPSGDIRYSLHDDEDFAEISRALKEEILFREDEDFDAEKIVDRGSPRTSRNVTMTVGQLKKLYANNKVGKVYSKKDALSVVNRFVGIGDLTQKTRGEIADAVWQILNESADYDKRRAVSHDMAEFIVAKMITDTKVENPGVREAKERLAYLQTGIGRLSFSESDISEIRHIRDKEGLRQVLGRWGYKGTRKSDGTMQVHLARRTPMETFVVDIAREMPGMEYLEDLHPVDAFLEIDSLYDNLRKQADDKWIPAYWDMADSEIPDMIKDIEDEIMRAFETEGEASRFSRVMSEKLERVNARADYWKDQHGSLSERARLQGRLMNKAQQLKDLKLGTFANATQHDSETFRSTIGKLSRIDYRGTLNVAGTRKIISDLNQWYTKEDVKKGIFGYQDKDNPGMYVQGVADMLDSLANGTGFSNEELDTLLKIMSYFTQFVQNFGKVYRRGRWIDAKPEAERYIEVIRANEAIDTPALLKLMDMQWMRKYGETFFDPLTVARRNDMYESGFWTEIMEELRTSAVDSAIAEAEILADYEEFLEKNKGYVRKATKETVEYRESKISRMHLISLYMTMKRKHAWLGITESGFEFEDVNGKKIKVAGGVISDTKVSEADAERYVSEQRKIIEDILTDTDKEYIAIIERAYNEQTRKLKVERDMQRLGFTNATDGYYYPIRREYIAHNVDSNDIADEIDRVSRASFNKNTVKGARQKLYIESADKLFRRHVHAVCQYAYLSPVIETYNCIYNLDVSERANDPVSVASQNSWKEGNAYFAKMISDIQGITPSTEGMKILRAVRGSFAKYQLGANPKVWFTQMSSLFAATSILDADCVARSMTVSADGVDEYCPLAKLRKGDNTAAQAQAVVDNKAKRGLNKASDVLMAPIGMMDRFTVCRLFGACQAQIEKNGGAKVGTEANKIEAGKLLTKVILETQQNTLATEKSAAARTSSEIVKTLTMFRSDAIKVTGRVIDGVGEVSVLKKKIAQEQDADIKAELQKRLKIAGRKSRKAIAALVASSVFMVCVARLFHWLYAKEDEEDESVAQTMVLDTVGNLFGGLPLITDVISRITDGYEVGNYAYSAVNDLLSSAIKMVDIASSLLTDDVDTTERNRALRSLVYSVGQVTGLPVRNIYNTLYGLTKRVSPTTAYTVDGAFYEKNYKNDLYRAIEDDDAQMTSYIMSILLGERLGDGVSEAVFNETLLLTQKGHKILPREIPKSITVGDTEYILSSSQRDAILETYSGSQTALEKLFATKKYVSLSDERKAQAIDYVYDTYYDIATQQTLENGVDKRGLMAKAVGAQNLALLYVDTKGLTSDKDANGKTISGSKRKKIIAAICALPISTEQKLLLICSKGYSIKDGDIRGLSAEKAKKMLLRYVISLKGMTKAERARLAEVCGFEVINGAISLKKAKKA